MGTRKVAARPWVGMSSRGGLRAFPRPGMVILGAVLLVAPWLVGCAGRTQPAPSAGYERGGVPDLRGVRLLVLPLQLWSGVHADAGLEVEYALGRAQGAQDWVMPASLRTALSQSPGVGVRIDALPVSVFLAGEVERVGDPLFGGLYRLGALTGASVALLPVEARARAQEDDESVEISAALVDIRSGRVLWFGVVEGRRGPPGDLSLAATAAEALAQRIVVP